MLAEAVDEYIYMDMEGLVDQEDGWVLLSAYRSRSQYVLSQ